MTTPSAAIPKEAKLVWLSTFQSEDGTFASIARLPYGVKSLSVI